MYLLLFIFASLILQAFSAQKCKNQDYDRLKNGKCYRLFKTPMDYNSAAGGCRLTHGKLAVIHNYTDNTEVGVWSAGWSAPEVWIGLVCPDLGSCKWADGTDLDYTNFDDTPPDLSKGTCFYMEAGKVTLTQYNPWQNADCSTKMMFICESVIDEPPVGTTPQSITTASLQCGSYTYYNGKCYGFGSTPMLVSDAELACAADGGHLVSIHEMSTNSFIMHFVQQQSPNTVAVWIGLRLLSNSIYVWTDGTPRDHNMIPKGLVVNPPSSFSMSVTPAILPGHWIPESSSILLPYVCQRATSF